MLLSVTSHKSGHVESAWHIVNYYLNGIESALPRVRNDAMAWAQYIINTIDHDISQSLKYAIALRLEKKHFHSMILYSKGFIKDQL